MTTPDLETLVAGQHHDPHAVLGPHVGPDGVTVRVLRPMASTVTVLTADGRQALEHERDGLWHVVLPGREVPDYRLEVEYDGRTVDDDDPYRFLPTLGEVDMHLIGEGRHERLWSVLGSHARTYETVRGPVSGTSFAVWAPNARGVRVSGDFNRWDSRSHPMRSMGSSGIWELFIPGVASGARYKFDVCGADGNWRQKADPMACYAETAPANASIVFESTYQWNDAAWMERRADHRAHVSPMSIYELHLGSWRRDRSYHELAAELVDYVRDLGFTHVEMLPVMEHPYGGSWGYQVTSYYAPTSRFGDPDDFRYLVDQLHAAGIGVIVDWVPAHFPKDEWALAQFDGTPLYEHSDPARAEHPDWGTLVFDFGRAEVRNFLVANALYWLEEFHIDGIRVDAVASMLYLDYSREPGEWTPNVHGGRENLEAVSFLQEMNATCYKHMPGAVTIAEESTSWPGVTRPTHLGGLGFGKKWNMGWMHETLDYFSKDPLFRKIHHDRLTFGAWYAFTENFVLPLSHDEAVHGKGSLIGKMPGDDWQKFANLRCLYGTMWTHPGKKLLFMGSDFGQWNEWNCETSLQWDLLQWESHQGLKKLIADLNGMLRRERALHEVDFDYTGFEWIDCHSRDESVLAYLRKAKNPEDMLAVCMNFTPVPRNWHRLGVPHGGFWREILN
ncbi:MAG: 1,4-alpha-glucan branching protein GlgB, partial [Nocardioidaceae bacterium]